MLDVRLVELRPEQVTAGRGRGEVAGEEQRQDGKEGRLCEVRVLRCAGNVALRRVDSVAVLGVDGADEHREC